MSFGNDALLESDNKSFVVGVVHSPSYRVVCFCFGLGRWDALLRAFRVRLFGEMSAPNHPIVKAFHLWCDAIEDSGKF